MRKKNDNRRYIPKPKLFEERVPKSVEDVKKLRLNPRQFREFAKTFRFLQRKAVNEKEEEDRCKREKDIECKRIRKRKENILCNRRRKQRELYQFEKTVSKTWKKDLKKMNSIRKQYFKLHLAKEHKTVENNTSHKRGIYENFQTSIKNFEDLNNMERQAPPAEEETKSNVSKGTELEEISEGHTQSLVDQNSHLVKRKLDKVSVSKYTEMFQQQQSKYFTQLHYTLAVVDEPQRHEQNLPNLKMKKFDLLPSLSFQNKSEKEDKAKKLSETIDVLVSPKEPAKCKPIGTIFLEQELRQFLFRKLRKLKKVSVWNIKEENYKEVQLMGPHPFSLSLCPQNFLVEEMGKLIQKEENKCEKILGGSTEKSPALFVQLFFQPLKIISAAKKLCLVIHVCIDSMLPVILALARNAPSKGKVHILPSEVSGNCFFEEVLEHLTKKSSSFVFNVEDVLQQIFAFIQTQTTSTQCWPDYLTATFDLLNGKQKLKAKAEARFEEFVERSFELAEFIDFFVNEVEAILRLGCDVVILSPLVKTFIDVYREKEQHVYIYVDPHQCENSEQADDSQDFVRKENSPYILYIRDSSNLHEIAPPTIVEHFNSTLLEKDKLTLIFRSMLCFYLSVGKVTTTQSLEQLTLQLHSPQFLSMLNQVKTLNKKYNNVYQELCDCVDSTWECLPFLKDNYRAKVEDLFKTALEQVARATAFLSDGFFSEFQRKKRHCQLEVDKINRVLVRNPSHKMLNRKQNVIEEYKISSAYNKQEFITRLDGLKNDAFAKIVQEDITIAKEIEVIKGKFLSSLQAVVNRCLQKKTQIETFDNQRMLYLKQELTKILSACGECQLIFDTTQPFLRFECISGMRKVFLNILVVDCFFKEACLQHHDSIQGTIKSTEFVEKEVEKHYVEVSTVITKKLDAAAHKILSLIQSCKVRLPEV
eukprot:snap_masked-scaffold_5-processed-gene-14.31-mRNA-1 protein AED:1.00 eAED:1.00 QI:0/-1/0/0/-1/1/1/0/928